MNKAMASFAVYMFIMFLVLCLAISQTNENNKASQTTVPTSQTVQTTASKRQTTEPLTEKEVESEETTTELTTEAKTSQIESVSSSVAFFYDDGEPVFVTHDEYYQICGVVMNETGYGSYEGCVAVAQCIRNQIIREKRKGNPYDIVSIRALYGEHYTRTPNDRVRRAVTDVFYNHVVVTKEPIIAWCNGGSSWHNKQILVCSFDGNNFYKLTKKDW